MHPECLESKALSPIPKNLPGISIALWAVLTIPKKNVKSGDLVTIKIINKYLLLHIDPLT